MKKYFLGLTAVVLALAFSAFTKPFTMQTFKLKTNPVTDNVVETASNWTTSVSGQFFGICAGSVQDLACKIQIDNSRSRYFHTESSEVLLNTKAYADANDQDYLEIADETGLLDGGVQDYIISSILAKHNVGNDVYETNQLGSDLSFSNAQEGGED